MEKRGEMTMAPEKVMMKCGHAANSEMLGQPCCVICFPKADSMSAAPKPELDGRFAKCTDCSRTMPSDTTLAFFSFQPDKNMDRYYCGCEGFD